MKKILGLGLVALVILGGCTTSRNVFLTDVDPLWKPYVFDKDYDGILLSVGYETLEKPNYDDIFREAAVQLGLVKHLNFALTRSEKAPEEFWNKARKIWFEKANLAGIKTLEEGAKRIYEALEQAGKDKLVLEALYPLLTAEYTLSFGPRATASLDKTIAALKNLNPEKDFSGAQVAQIPGTIKAIDRTVKNLTAAKDEWVILVDRAQKLGAKILSVMLNFDSEIKKLQEAVQKPLVNPVPEIKIPSVQVPSFP